MAMPDLVIVRPEFRRHSSDATEYHTPTRTAGNPFSGPTVYVTTCGLYAHIAVLPGSDLGLPLCERCASHH
jgi:hypothetical protein